MAETSGSLAHLILSGRVYLAHEVPEALVDGDLRLSQNPNDARYIKVEVLWEWQWHEVASWHLHKEFRYFMAEWPDPWAPAKIFQRLLQALRPHLEIRYGNYILGYGLCISRGAESTAKPWLEAALAEANQLFAAHAPQD